MRLDLRSSPAMLGSSVFLITLLASIVVAVALPRIVDGVALQTSSTVLALPFIALGLWAYAQGRRWLHLAGTAVVSLALALFDWRAGLLVAMVLAGFAGVLASTRIIHEHLLVATLSDLESYGTSSKRSLRARVLGSLLAVPDDFDTRGITFNRGLVRDDLRAPAACYVMGVAPLMLILLIYLAIGPGTHAHIYDSMLSAFASVMYIVALSLPWMVFSALDVRVTYRGTTYRPGDGLISTSSKFSVALLVAFIIVLFAVGINLITTYVMVASVLFCLSMMAPYALGLDMTDNDAYLERMYVEWTSKHPVTVGSGLDGSTVGKGVDGVPGTPRRPMDSCFPQMKN